MQPKNSGTDKKFSSRLSKLMGEEGYSQSSLALAMGIGQSTINGWLAGSTPQPRMMKQLADHLSVTIEWLRDGTEPMKRETLNEPSAPYRTRPRELHEVDFGQRWEEMAAAAATQCKEWMLLLGSARTKKERDDIMARIQRVTDDLRIWMDSAIPFVTDQGQSQTQTDESK